MDDPKDRKINQKLIYLAQEIGFDVGDHRFSWYLSGPYSATVADLLWSTADERDDVEQRASLIRWNERGKQKIAALNRLVNAKPESVALGYMA